MYSKFWLESHREKDHLTDLGIDVKVRYGKEKVPRLNYVLRHEDMGGWRYSSTHS